MPAISRFARGLVVTTLLTALNACSSGGQDEDTPIAPAANSGFLLGANGFAFENFASGYEEARMSPELVQRMFGPSVCSGKTSPCVLTPAARVWTNRINASMDGGRCEGLAVLSSLFYGGAVDPAPFGGPSARKLSLDGNPALQREIAYWFATQDVPMVAKTQKLDAKGALRLLSTALQPAADEFYRIGIVRKTARGMGGGHALTPIRYERAAEEGVYTLYVYDNNYPDEERTMKIDVANGRWEYQASATPNETAALYYGDATNKNPMYFGKTKTRVGTLPAPFADGVPESMTLFHGVNASGMDKSGNAAGIGPDGEIVETGKGEIAPSFTAVVPTWTNIPPVKLFLPTGDTALMVSGGEYGLGAADGTITQYGSSYTVDVSRLQLPPGVVDALAISNGGRETAYTNKSQTAMALDTSVAGKDGRILELRMEVPAGSTSVTTQLDPATGQMKMTADGTAGAKITITVTKVDANTGVTITGTMTVDGAAKNTITVDANKLIASGQLTGQQDTGGGASTPVGASCSDGAKNGDETDVDCGGACPTRCADGKGCVALGDCMSNICNPTTQLCVSSPCLNGVADGTETDVDCGGACSTKCALGKVCVGGADCISGICDAGFCNSLDRFVFVSSTITTGNIGGLAGADAKCQALAVSAGLGGTYKAFLSDFFNSASARLSHGPGKYLLVDGVTVVAADAAGFFLPSHLAPINKDEKNMAVGAVEVWTGSFGAGNSDGSEACAMWTSAVDPGMPTAGRSDLIDERWMSYSPSACGVARHLYCVQQ